MFLTLITPTGQVTSLDLGALPVWRLELICFGNDKEMPEAKPFLALSLRYVVAGTTAHATIAAMDCKTTGGELDAAVKIGLPSSERAGNKERLREALKILHNSLPNNAVEQILRTSERLVDLYHELLSVFFGQEVTALASLGARLKAEFEGWRFAVTDHRHQPWLMASASAAAGMGSAPGSARPLPPEAAPKPRGGKKAATTDDGMGAPPTAAPATEGALASPTAEGQATDAMPPKDDLFT